MTCAPAYLQPYLQHPILSAEEERSQLQSYRAGDRRARECLLRHNYRYCWREAKKFQQKYLTQSVDDLFQAAVIGFGTAIERFDISKGYRLLTYASWYVRDAMQHEAGSRKRNREFSADPDLFEYQVKSSPERTPIDRLLLQERDEGHHRLRHRIWQALRQFPRLIRKILLLHLLGQSFAQIGRRFGLSRQTTRNYFNRHFPIFKRSLVTQQQRSHCRLVINRTPQLRMSMSSTLSRRLQRDDRQVSHPSLTRSHHSFVEIAIRMMPALTYQIVSAIKASRRTRPSIVGPALQLICAISSPTNEVISSAIATPNNKGLCSSGKGRWTDWFMFPVLLVLRLIDSVISSVTPFWPLPLQQWSRASPELPSVRAGPQIFWTRSLLSHPEKEGLQQSKSSSSPSTVLSIAF